jgi:CRP/FNR family transcriptional regulator
VDYVTTSRPSFLSDADGEFESEHRGAERAATPLPGRPLKLGARQLVCDGEDGESRLFRVVQGAAQTFSLRADGRRVVFHFLFPGDIFWPRAVAAERQALETLTSTVLSCAGEAEMAVRDPAEAVPAREHAPALPGRGNWPNHWAFRLMQQEVLRASDHRSLLSLRSGTERVAAFLLAMIERAEARGEDSVHLWLPMTREDIADHLGLTTETVCRIFARLQRSRILFSRSRSRIEILDPAGLERLAQGENL